MKLFNIPLVMLFSITRAEDATVDICTTECLQAALCFAEGTGCASFDKDIQKWTGVYEACNGDDNGGALECAECYPDCDVGYGYDPCTTDCAMAAPCFEGAGCAKFDKDTKKWSGDYVGCNGDDTGSALDCAFCYPDCDQGENDIFSGIETGFEEMMEGFGNILICTVCATTPLEDDGVSDECFYAVDEAFDSVELDACLNTKSPADVSAACKASIFEYLECPDMSGMAEMMICGMCSATPLDEAGVSQDCFDALNLMAGDEDVDLEGCEDVESPVDVSPACKESIFEYLECFTNFTNFTESSPLPPEEQQEICALCTTSPLNEKGVSEDCFNAVGEAGGGSADMAAECEGIVGPKDVSVPCKTAVFDFYGCGADGVEADFCTLCSIAETCFAEGAGCANFDKDTQKWLGDYAECNGDDEGGALECAACYPDCDATSNPLSPEEKQEICALCTTSPLTEKGVSEGCYNAVGEVGVGSADMAAVCEEFELPEDVSVLCKIAVFGFFGCDAGEADPCSELCVPAAACFGEGAGCANLDKLTQKWSGIYDGCNGDDQGSAISCALCYPDCDTSSSSTVDSKKVVSAAPSSAPVSSPVADAVPTSEAPVVSPTVDANVQQAESPSNIIVPSILLVLVMTVAGIVVV